MPKFAFALAAAGLVGIGLMTSIRGDNFAQAIQEQRRASDIEQREAALAAMCHAIETNADYCTQWLEGDDYASLAKTTRGLSLLCEILAAESTDDAWLDRVRELNSQVNDLQAAAGEKAQARCKELIAAIRAAGTKLAPTNVPLVATPKYSGRGNVRNTMDLLDGTYADAKAALTFGDVDVAQRESLVLWRLGEYLKSMPQRGGSEQWNQLADSFAGAALAAASGEASEAAVRQALKVARERCENCHNR